MPVWLNTFYDLNSISKEMQWNMSLVSPNRDSEWIAVCQMLWITANYIITTLLCNIRWILSLFRFRVYVLSTQWIGLMCTVAIQELESPPWCACRYTMHAKTLFVFGWFYRFSIVKSNQFKFPALVKVNCESMFA